MANEILAAMNQPLPDAGREEDYQSFSAALGSSARGRAFLAEYARRNRHADTEVLLAAFHRLETLVHSQKSSPEADRIRQDLHALLDTIRAARPQIDNSPGAIKAATLAALTDFVQARLEALVAPARAPISQVPPPEQPELPIPSPLSAPQPAIALVYAAVTPPPSAENDRAQTARDPEKRAPVSGHDYASTSLTHVTGIIPEVNFFDSASPMPTPVEAPPAVPVAASAPAEILPVAELAALPVETPAAAPVAKLASAEIPPATPIANSAPVEIPPAERETAASALSALIEFAAPDAIEPPAPVVVEPPAPETKAAARPFDNPLAGIMALSEEERIALFT